jgi:D-alanyl-D-alanine carboxypeptidase
MAKRKKKSKIKWFIPIFILLIIAVVVIFQPDRISEEKPHEASLEHGWSLILINKDNYIPEDYEVNLLKLSNGKKVDERIYPDLQKMFDDARAAGLELFVAQGYRTADEQQKLLDNKQEAYENEGKSPAEAKELAEQWVAVPGTSEHQLGIAVDINADTEKCKAEDVYKWLSENAHKYGFINRYPADKTEITGIIYEPWHYRYVGVDAAKIMHEEGSTYEQYYAKYIAVNEFK